MFGLCDANNFYASCERVFNPSLIGRPVVVLSNNDGCVIARSNEAKKLGIEMGAPYFQIKQLARCGTGLGETNPYCPRPQIYKRLRTRSARETGRQTRNAVSMHTANSPASDTRNRVPIQPRNTTAGDLRRHFLFGRGCLDMYSWVIQFG